MNSPVRLRVSAADASTPTGVFNQWFEALFPPRWNSGLGSLSPGPPAAAWLASYSFAHLAPQSATVLGPPPAAALPGVHCALPPVSAPPTGLDGCVFFISLVVGLPYSSIFCQSGCFLILNCCCLSFGCARRHSESTYASILAGSLFLSSFCNGFMR